MTNADFAVGCPRAGNPTESIAGDAEDRGGEVLDEADEFATTGRPAW